jgi:hypothetical protein
MTQTGTRKEPCLTWPMCGLAFNLVIPSQATFCVEKFCVLEFYPVECAKKSDLFLVMGWAPGGQSSVCPPALKLSKGLAFRDTQGNFGCLNHKSPFASATWLQNRYSRTTPADQRQPAGPRCGFLQPLPSVLPEASSSVLLCWPHPASLTTDPQSPVPWQLQLKANGSWGSSRQHMRPLYLWLLFSITQCPMGAAEERTKYPNHIIHKDRHMKLFFLPPPSPPQSPTIPSWHQCDHSGPQN